MRKILLIMLGGPPQAMKDRLAESLKFIEKAEGTSYDVDIFLTGYPSEKSFYKTTMNKNKSIIENPNFSPINTYGNTQDLEKLLKDSEKVYNYCVCCTSEKHSKRFKLCFDLLNLKKYFTNQTALITYKAGNDGFSEPIKLLYYKVAISYCNNLFGKNISTFMLNLEKDICYIIRKYIFFWKFK